MNARVRVLVAVAAGAALAHTIVAPGSSAAVPGVACRPAVLLDGALLCGARAPLDVRARCPSAVDVADGDAFDAACRPGRMDPDTLARLEVVLDANAASAADLTSLPGIGPALAGRIVDGRPYATTDDLLGVKGIGPATLARIRSRLRCGAQPTARSRDFHQAAPASG